MLMKGAWSFRRTRKMKSPKSRYMSIYKIEYDECIDFGVVSSCRIAGGQQST